MRGVAMGNPHVLFNSALNIVVDGNSLVYGQGGAQNIPRVMAKTAPISAATHPITQVYDATALAGSPTNKWKSDKGIVVYNSGVSGETWRQMNGLDGGNGAADVDAAFVAGAANVLILWEGTNSITLGGRTPAQAIQDATDYITARQAAASSKGGHWVVMIGTCLPRQISSSEANTIALNGNLDSYNASLRSQYSSMGAKGVFDVRQSGSPFNLPDYTYASFSAALNGAAGYWTTTDPTNSLTHLASNGYQYVVDNVIMPALLRLPRR